MEIVLGIILLLAAIFLVVAVLLQQGSDGVSAAVTGSADTYFGKTKGRTRDKVLSKLTMIVGICFVVVVIAVYIIQPDRDYHEYLNYDVESETEAVETEAEPAETTEGEATEAAATEAVEAEATQAAN